MSQPWQSGQLVAPVANHRAPYVISQSLIPLQHQLYICDHGRRMVIVRAQLLKRVHMLPSWYFFYGANRYLQVQSTILEKHEAKSVGCREAFRKKTLPVFVAAVILFGVSVLAFVYAFAIVGYIKPCTQNPKPVASHVMLRKGYKPQMLLNLMSFGRTFSACCRRVLKASLIASLTVRGPLA
jgi:hypothetical protein